MAHYTSYYGFSENPFALSADAEFFFPSDSHSEALASLQYGIDQRKGFVLILGEAGIGKTILIHHLIKTLNKKATFLFFPNSNLSFEQMLKEMLFKLKLTPKSETKGAMIHELYYHLIRCMERDENVCIIIDEAENIGTDVIEEVRLLANLETSTSKLIQIVLVGKPQLGEKLYADAIRQIRQRIVIRCRMKPLTLDESERYIDHRLKIVGSGRSQVFTDKAVALICEHAEGIPFRLNLLCANALTVGHLLSEKKISPGTVNKILGEKDILTDERAGTFVPRFRSSALRIAVYFLIVLAIATMGFYFGRDYLNTLLDQRSSFVSKLSKSRDNNNVTPDDKPLDIHDGTPITPQVDVPNVEPQRTKIPDAPSAIISSTDKSVRVKEVVEVERGASLSALAFKHYQAIHETLVDHILKVNPEITNVNLILVNQRILIPQLTAPLLIIRSSEKFYTAHLRTYANLKNAKQYKRVAESLGKDIEITTWKASPNETWYRVVAGPFYTREEGLEFVAEIKKKGFSIIPDKSEKSW